MFSNFLSLFLPITITLLTISHGSPNVLHRVKLPTYCSCPPHPKLRDKQGPTKWTDRRTIIQQLDDPPYGEGGIPNGFSNNDHAKDILYKRKGDYTNMVGETSSDYEDPFDEESSPIGPRRHDEGFKVITGGKTFEHDKATKEKKSNTPKNDDGNYLQNLFNRLTESAWD
ncbi:uncharacterized protein LOC131841604 [Achroia grisella]|uniref:uncharacterized protein LOC131841604 n=1 Tax=Achroia grisella TaxID=688607 RepID=UPI0027D28A1F|nr:uncharacterized protein LOC131841604 [Achroia grisella]